MSHRITTLEAASLVENWTRSLTLRNILLYSSTSESNLEYLCCLDRVVWNDKGIGTYFIIFLIKSLSDIFTLIIKNILERFVVIIIGMT